MNLKYAVIIPAKNEENNIARTLNSIVKQEFLPETCIVVDDNSDDNTAPIVKDFEKKYPFIRYYKNFKPKQNYLLGGHVVEVFNIGLEYLHSLGFNPEYVIKMDADLDFKPDIIKKLFEKTNSEKPGIFSGMPYYMHNNIRINDYSPLWHAHGQFKIYNMKCLKEIGGIPLSLGWDTADNIKAMSCGWKTMAYRDIYYKMNRKVGGKSSLVKGRVNHGIGAYVLGYNFGYFMIKVMHDIFRPPYVLGATYMVLGYFKAFVNRRKVILEQNEKKLLRKLLWESLVSRIKSRDFVIFQLFKTKK